MTERLLYLLAILGHGSSCTLQQTSHATIGLEREQRVGFNRKVENHSIRIANTVFVASPRIEYTYRRCSTLSFDALSSEQISSRMSAGTYSGTHDRTRCPCPGGLPIALDDLHTGSCSDRAPVPMLSGATSLEKASELRHI